MDFGLITWQIFKTETIPQIGLINYGYAVTKSGIMVLYGGQVEITPECSFQKRTLQTSSDLWIVNMPDILIDFILVEWMSSEMGGYSTIISLNGYLLVVFNINFQNGMKLLDMNRLTSYAINSKNVPENFLRTSFGIAGNGTHFIMYGGYDQLNGIFQPSTSDLVFQLSFSVNDVGETNASQIQILTTSIVSILCAIAIIGLILRIRTRMTKQSVIRKHLEITLKEKRMEESAIALENSKKEFENRIKNLVNDPTFTATLAVAGDVGLYIPGFREFRFNIDFRSERSLAKGGMGEVFIGKLLTAQVLQLNNNNGLPLKAVEN
jgi:hypothetical protein